MHQPLPPRVFAYVWTVITAGTLVATTGLARWSVPVAWPLLLSVWAAALLSPLKLRLPGLNATYSCGSLPVLWALTNLTLPESLVTGAAVALAQTYIRASNKATGEQAAFNVANLMLTVSVCAWVIGLVTSSELPTAHPVVLALTASVYFAVNTALVSGVLALLHGKNLRDVTSEWYTWSLPYHLAGAATLTFLPAPHQSTAWEGAFMLLALLALLYFYGTLERSQEQPEPAPRAARLPSVAKIYISAVITGAVLVTAFAWQQQGADLPRLAAWLLLTAFTSTQKVRLPGLQGTVSLNFVALLAAIVELRLAEVALLALVGGAVQCLWMPALPARREQVAFSMAALVVSTAAAYWIGHTAADPVGFSLVALLCLSTTLLYLANTLLVCTALSLVSARSLAAVWQRCHFWVFALYLIGANVAGLIVATGRTIGWGVALLAVPSMYLIFISYRLQLRAKRTPKTEKGAVAAA